MAKKVKPIQAVTYKYVPTGKLGTNGYPEYKNTQKKVVTLTDTSFRVLGQKNYKIAKARKDTYVTFDKTPRVKSVTRRHKDGSKFVTYYKRAK